MLHYLRTCQNFHMIAEMEAPVLCVIQAQEYIFHKSENEWREETRPIPELAYRGEVKKIEQCYLNPAYGDMQLIRESPTSVFVVYWNGICWKELKREEKEIG